MLRRINGKPALARHNVRRTATPSSITLRCDCGWWYRQPLHSDGPIAAKLRAAVDDHARAIAPARIGSVR